MTRTRGSGARTAVTTLPSDRTGERLARFDGVERALHWVNAALFFVVLFTAGALYVGPLSTIVGRRALVKEVHVIVGLLLPVPFILARIGPWSRGLRRDIRALNRWDGDDRRWFRSLGRDRGVRLGKFNPGQKLNAAFVAGAVPVMLATGSIMKWFGPFSDSWRTGATFVHDWIAIGLFAVIVGHIAIALSDPDALRGMVRGWVPASWARRHRPKWFEEISIGE
ncbi:MAG: formate dehydrogenase [Actinobacteria bacterium]|nr:MAG: formate dehydrogenase [Actinomycetota bacterium]